MDGKAMNQYFLLKAKSLNRTDVVDLTSYDIMNLLNHAQDIVIDELLVNRQFTMLQGITTSAQVLAAAFESYSNAPGGSVVVDLFDLSSFRNYIGSSINFTRTFAPTISSSKVATSIMIDRGEAFKYETTEANKPIFTQPRCYVEGDYLVIIPDAYTTVVSADISYIKIPTEIALDTTSDLPLQLHEYIVDVAVNKSGEVVNVADLKR